MTKEEADKAVEQILVEVQALMDERDRGSREDGAPLRLQWAKVHTLVQNLANEVHIFGIPQTLYPAPLGSEPVYDKRIWFSNEQARDEYVESISGYQISVSTIGSYKGVSFQATMQPNGELHLQTPDTLVTEVLDSADDLLRQNALSRLTPAQVRALGLVTQI